MLSKVKALLSKSLLCKQMHWVSRNMTNLIIPTFMILLLIPLIPCYSQIFQANPDSIPFDTAVNYPVGDGPQSIFCADLDGDGDLDLAVANYTSDNVSILKNNGNGTFYLDSNYAVGDGPQSVFCADLDGDGDLDLAVAYCRCGVSILMNNGDGTFQPKVDYPAGDYPTSVFCADLDRDGDVDLAVADFNLGNVSILMNKGDGTFLPKVDYHVVGAGVSSVFCADLDTFPGLDLAATLLYNNGIVILTNNGNGTFELDSMYDVLDYPYSVFCADLDGDGALDLAVGYEYVESNNVSILKNNGDGTFRPKVDYNVGNVPMSVFCADLDRDGDLDLAVANRESNNVSILINLSHLRSYSLLSPPNDDSIKTPVTFNWQPSIDPDPNDTVRYDLYLSRNIAFNPYVVYANLLGTTLTDTLGIKLWYWKVKAYDTWGAVRWSNQTWSFYIYLCGDCNADGVVDIGDIVWEINYLFKGGPPPQPYAAGDVNCDGVEDVGDVVYKINYLFKGGAEPCLNCP